VHTARLRRWLGCRKRTLLFNSQQNLELMVTDLERPKEGASGSAAMAAGLVLELCERKLRTSRLGITGTLDLCGRLHTVYGVEEKVVAAQRSRVEVFILPDSNMEDLRSSHFATIPEGARAYAMNTLGAADTMIRALQMSLEGSLGNWIGSTESLDDIRCRPFPNARWLRPGAGDA
jgi:predicted ATPase with chaperone activity